MAARLISAAIALPAAVALMYLGSWYFLGLLVFVGGACLVEFMGMTLKDDAMAKWVLSGIGVALIVLTMTGVMAMSGGFAVAALMLLAVLIFFLFRTGDMQTVAQRASMGVTGVLWAGGLLGVTGCLRLLPQGLEWLLLACMLAWGSDTGAYFAGRFLGNKKLYEKVSPKKTWAGAIGGVIAATGGAFALRAVLGLQISAPHLLVIAPVAAILGQIGDLAESLLKRSVGAKDSGKIMPGHGGLFDRVDALIFIGPPVLAYATLVLGLKLTWIAF